MSIHNNDVNVVYIYIKIHWQYQYYSLYYATISEEKKFCLRYIWHLIIIH